MRVLLITGKTRGHNLFPIKDCLDRADHQTDIALTLEHGYKFFFSLSLEAGGGGYDAVLCAKEPSTAGGEASAPLGKTLRVLQGLQAANPKTRIAIISSDFSTEEICQLVGGGWQYFRVDELDEIVEFCT